MYEEEEQEEEEEGGGEKDVAIASMSPQLCQTPQGGPKHCTCAANPASPASRMRTLAEWKIDEGPMGNLCKPP